MENERPTDGISRRQALKRVAAVGAIAWATPVVQTLNMGRAWAASPQAVCHSVKLELGRRVPYNGRNAPGFKCFQSGDTLYAGDASAPVSLSVNSNGTWTVALGPGCYFAFGYTQGYVGSGYTDGGSRTLVCGRNPTPSGTTGVISFSPSERVHRISNVQLTFCCVPPGA